ncbi:unnamed protein product, partial [Mesorhabditis spiculigera]
MPAWPVNFHSSEHKTTTEESSRLFSFAPPFPICFDATFDVSFDVPQIEKADEEKNQTPVRSLVIFCVFIFIAIFMILGALIFVILGAEVQDHKQIRHNADTVAKYELLRGEFGPDHIDIGGNDPKSPILPTPTWQIPTESYRPQHYDVDLHVYLPGHGTPIPKEREFDFFGIVNITLAVDEPQKHIELHSKKLELVAATLIEDGGKLRRLSIRFNNTLDRVALSDGNVINKGTHIIQIAYRGVISRSLFGLYRSSYQTRDGQKRFIATTQFEVTNAREMTPCFDEPRFKATWRFSVRHPVNTTATTNAAIHGQPFSEEHGGLSWIRTKFETSPVMSSYIVALVIHDFGYESVIASNNVKIGIYARKEAMSHTKTALDAAALALPEIERLVGVKYPLPKLDIFAIPDFSAGAMENWGIMTFKERREPTTSYALTDMFGGLTYQKAAYGIYTMYATLGEKRFFAMVKAYLEKNKYSTTSWRDIWMAADEEKHGLWQQAVQAHLDHILLPGYPRIDVARIGKNRYAITTHRHCLSDETMHADRRNDDLRDSTWRIPIQYPGQKELQFVPANGGKPRLSDLFPMAATGAVPYKLVLEMLETMGQNPNADPDLIRGFWNIEERLRSNGPTRRMLEILNNASSYYNGLAFPSIPLNSTQRKLKIAAARQQRHQDQRYSMEQQELLDLFKELDDQALRRKLGMPVADEGEPAWRVFEKLVIEACPEGVMISKCSKYAASDRATGYVRAIESGDDERREKTSAFMWKSLEIETDPTEKKALANAIIRSKDWKWVERLLDAHINNAGLTPPDSTTWYAELIGGRQETFDWLYNNMSSIVKSYNESSEALKELIETAVGKFQRNEALPLRVALLQSHPDLPEALRPLRFWYTVPGESAHRGRLAQEIFVRAARGVRQASAAEGGLIGPACDEDPD